MHTCICVCVHIKWLLDLTSYNQEMLSVLMLTPLAGNCVTGTHSPCVLRIIFVLPPPKQVWVLSSFGLFNCTYPLSSIFRSFWLCLLNLSPEVLVDIGQFAENDASDPPWMPPWLPSQGQSSRQPALQPVDSGTSGRWTQLGGQPLGKQRGSPGSCSLSSEHSLQEGAALGVSRGSPQHPIGFADKIKGLSQWKANKCLLETNKNNYSGNINLGKSPHNVPLGKQR